MAQSSSDEQECDITIEMTSNEEVPEPTITFPSFLRVSGQPEDDNAMITLPNIPTQFNADIKRQSISISNRLLIRNLKGVFNTTVCKQMLYIFQTKFSGASIYLAVLTYTFGKLLTQLQDMGNRNFMSEGNHVLDVYYKGGHSPEEGDQNIMHFKFETPNTQTVITFSYTINSSLFIGEKFPECVPEWIREVMRTARSYKLIVTSNNTYIK